MAYSTNYQQYGQSGPSINGPGNFPPPQSGPSLAGPGNFPSPEHPANPNYTPGDWPYPNQANASGILEDIWNQAQGGINASNMLTQAQSNELFNQIGFAGLQADLSSNIARQNFGFGERGIGLGREALNVQQGALARQMGLLPQEYALQQQGFDVQGKRLDEQTREAWLGTAEQQRAAKGAGIAQGNLMLPGATQQRADIKQHLENALTNIGFSREDLGIARKKAELDFQEKQAQQQDANKMLGIQSKRLDLSEDEIKARLQNTLDQIGISNQVSVSQLLGEMYKVQQGGISALSPLFGAIAQATGIYIPGQ